MTSPSLDAALVPVDVLASSGVGVRMGFDIGGTKTLGVVLAPSGAVLAHARLRTAAGRTGLLSTIERAAQQLAARSGVAMSEIASIGIPGMVAAEHGSIEHAVNLGVTHPLPLASLVREQLGFAGAILLENDVNVAARGVVEEQLLHDQVVSLLSVGTGLAAGLVVRGRLWRGAAGVAGEIGHISVDPSGPLCKCGQRGCIEQYASGSALERLWPTADDQLPAVALFASAQQGDPRAIGVRDGFGAALASAVQLIALSVDPDVIVLSGGVAALGEPLREVVSDALRRRAEVSPFLRSLQLEERLRIVSKSSTTAAIGAAALAG